MNRDGEIRCGDIGDDQHEIELEIEEQTEQDEQRRTAPIGAAPLPSMRSLTEAFSDFLQASGGSR